MKKEHSACPGLSGYSPSSDILGAEPSSLRTVSFMVAAEGCGIFISAGNSGFTGGGA